MVKRQCSEHIHTLMHYMYGGIVAQDIAKMHWGTKHRKEKKIITFEKGRNERRKKK